MKTTLIPTALVLTLSAALLAGCTPAPAEPIAEPTKPAATAEPTEAPVEEPAETPAEISIDEIVAGDTITREQATAIARNPGSGKKGYTFADGTIVAIDLAAPLPEAVKAEITGSIVSTKDAVSSDPFYTGLLPAIGNQQSTSGKRIVAVLPMTTQCEMFGPKLNVWRVGTSETFTETCYFSRDEAIAAAQGIVASQSDPTRWEVIAG